VSARAPTCTVHGGELRYRPAGHWWVCLGWDGERCCAIPAELVEAFIGDQMACTPVPGAKPSRWGYRPASTADPQVAM
jgi:hypothetical protein